MAKVWKIHQFPTWYIVLGITLLPVISTNLVTECNNRCSSSLPAVDSGVSVCDQTCRIESCFEGCTSWDNTTLTACNSACNNTYSAEPNRVQYCNSGCLFAENEYARAVTAQVGEPSAPTASFIESTHLTLMWTPASNSDVQYLVEWRFADIQSSSWNYYDPQPTTATSLNVTGLIPFATYQFRVLWVITPRHILTSNTSRDVQTDQGGVPSTAPVITSLTSSSPTSISVTWDPPPFPNGPITEYTIVVQNFNNQPTVSRSVGPSTTQITVADSNLQASTLYVVSVSARNMDGLGPSDTMNVTTSAAPNVTGIIPYLVIGATSFNLNILAGTSTVSFVDIQRLPENLEPSDVHIVESENVTIADVAVHYWMSLLYISDSAGRIHRRTIDTSSNLTTEPTEVLYNNSDPAPSKLDVDWLNDQLYFVQGTEIHRCDLNVTNCDPVVVNLPSIPTEMKVDPYVGYLYWSLTEYGIYRLSLDNMRSQVDSSEAELVIDLSGISVFVVNSESFQVVYTNTTGNSVLSAALDGTEQSVLRKSIPTNSYSFQNVTSMVFFDNLLIWTRPGNGQVQMCFGTPYPHSGATLHFETAPNVVSDGGNIFFCVDGFHGLDVFYPTSQPFPTPSSPPTSLQALFTQNTAEISWNRPQRVPGKGLGAWEEWLYEVRITDVTTGDVTVQDDISEIFAVAENLNASSEYAIQVRAYSSGGLGPWSDVFSGTTLIEVATDPYLLLANNTNIWRTGLDGNSQSSILMPPSAIRDIDWYGNYYIWSTTTGELYRSSQGGAAQQLTVDPASVSGKIEAIAVDWLSEFLYWADPDQNQIIRGRLSEPPANTVTDPSVINPYANNVVDVAIDSIQAFIYWTTTQSVEGSRLNGESPLVFYQTGDLSLDRVAGLTLDLGGGYLYWFVVSRQNNQDELKLYRAQLACTSLDPASTTEEIGDVLSATTSLALHFYSSKLFWINSNSQVVVSDDRGQRQALLPSSDVQTLTIVQSTLKPLPGNFTETPNVTAQQIPQSSIQVSGTWDNVTISWRPSSEVEFGTVFYIIGVLTPGGRRYDETIQDASFTITDLPPFQVLSITVRPYTYWFTTSPTSTSVTSPMSVPTVPLNPRVFALENRDIMTGETTYSAELRWSRPENINGILLGYNVSWGPGLDQLTILTVTTSDTEITYQFSNLSGNTTYFFQIEGFTEIGSGPSTEFVNITTGVSLPPPTIAVSTGSGVSLTDVDTGTETPLLGGAVAVAALAVVAEDEQVYFLEQTGDVEIKTSKLDGSEMTDVVDLNGQSRPSQSNFVVNWISRQLYWSDGQSIMTYDTTLTTSLAVVQTFYSPPSGNSVNGISVDPLGNSLFWTESTQSSSVLMTSALDGQNVRSLFGQTTSGRRRRSTGNCTCEPSLSPGSTIYVDSSDPTATSIYLVNVTSGDLWVSDTQGCQCRMLFDASQPNSGLPPDSLSVDLSRVYWSNAAAGIVASIDKQTGGDFQAQTGQNNVGFVLTYGTRLQPFPAPECLAPSDYAQPTGLQASASDSLTLTFDPVVGCPGISAAAPVYTVHYALVDSETSDQNCSSGLSCLTRETLVSPVSLGSLEPYTVYLTQVSVRNFYSSGSPVLGPVAVHQTSPGVPSAAQNVAVEVLIPSEVKVTWSRPLEVNGPLSDLQFSVLYSIPGQDSRTDFADTVSEGNDSYSVRIDELADATNYAFTVESYQASLPNDMFSSSTSQQATTFQVPAPVQSVATTSESLSVMWTAPDDGSAEFYQIQYRESGGSWLEALSGNATSGTQYNVTIGEGATSPLTPYTFYEVRTLVRYTSGLEYTYTGNEDILSVRTEATGPSAPGLPTVSETGTSPVTFLVDWTVPVANGPGTLMYTLDARPEATGDWQQVYDGPETSWILVDLDTGETYSFRVKARNDFSEGPYSPSSAGTFVPNPNPPDTTLFIIIGVVVAVLVIVAFVVIFLVCRHKRQQKDWETGGQFREDLELAQLRNYPNTIIRQDNSNYAVRGDNGQEVILPIFPRERLKLITFLGSGAFGEVFEGNALNILGEGSGETRVAVKTLRKGATDQEKGEFLKEATLMGNFKHPNIVSLMGVCLDNDPQYIILELMEGGDLLTYLRAARASSAANSKLSPLDLIEIILDVAKGCEYLEELHFVHRDLAARNCLVSTKLYDAHFRVVKIGDFGLARDIYKNDYYRKEGEGLLPVRWMAPEGLMDGYFSVQSDVWAYGVLVWEVMTKGQQPYPARSNVEVLKYVTAGGRLNRPDDCPNDIYQIMLKCWEKSTEDRPSFKLIREMVQDFRRKSGPTGRDNFGFESDKVNYSAVKKDIPPEMEDYLLPMDSKGAIAKKPLNVELPPDIDYDEADKKFEEESLKKNRGKGSKKKKDTTSSPFSSLRGRLPGATGEASRPRLEAALENLANHQDRSPDIEDRYLMYPVGSVSKATGAKMATPDSSLSRATGAQLAAEANEGPSGYARADLSLGPSVLSASVAANGDAPNRTDENDTKPRRHPNPFRATSLEELDGYDNIAFGANAGVTTSDYANV